MQSNILSANAYLAPLGSSPSQFAADVRRAGFNAVGWTEGTVDLVGARELARISVGEGLAITSLNSAGYFTWTDPSRQRKQDAVSARLMDAAAEMGASRLVIVAGGADGGLDASTTAQTLISARERVVHGLVLLDERASAMDVKLALEPIHPVDHLRKGCVNSITDALRIVNQMRVTDLVVDTFHSAWDPDLLYPRSDFIQSVGLVQVCNWSEPSLMSKPTRELPLDGRLDLRGVLSELVRNGYTAAFEFEMFDVHRADRSVFDLLASAHSQISEILSFANDGEAMDAADG